MKAINTALLILFNLFHLAIGALNAVDGSGGDADAISSIADNDDSLMHHPTTGGLRWRDLGVSLEPCPLTTAQMLDNKYNNNHVAARDDDGSNDEHYQHCLDDSEWLLHPSSGFVENGSLCGIIG